MCKCLAYLCSFFCKKNPSTDERLPLSTNPERHADYTGKRLMEYGIPKKHKAKHSKQKNLPIAPFFAKATTSRDVEYTPLPTSINTRDRLSIWEVCESELDLLPLAF